MAIATTSQFWNYRLNGENPTTPIGTNNGAWTPSTSPVANGSEVNGYWVHDNGNYSIVPEGEELTIFAILDYTITAPDNLDLIFQLDNGTYKSTVLTYGNKLRLYGVSGTYVEIGDLDFALTEDNPVPVSLRMTLDSQGTANLYVYEMVEDDDANQIFYTISADTSTGALIKWGNNTGEVRWASVYATDKGAFSPLELAPSDLATDTLLRMGLSIVQSLRDSKRGYLKTHVDNGSIKYGYDMSRQMLSRAVLPLINVVLQGLGSPTFAALGGGRIDQNYDVLIYVTTRGTTYEDAYRTGLNIVGECFDELYTTTGLNGTTDSLMEYSLELQTKLDDETTICTHLLTLTYSRRINMRHR